MRLVVMLCGIWWLVVVLPDGVVGVLRVVDWQELGLGAVVLVERALVALIAWRRGREMLSEGWRLVLWVWWVEAGLELVRGRLLGWWQEVWLLLVEALRSVSVLLLSLPVLVELSRSSAHRVDARRLRIIVGSWVKRRLGRQSRDQLHRRRLRWLLPLRMPHLDSMRLSVPETGRLLLLSSFGAVIINIHSILIVDHVPLMLHSRTLHVLVIDIELHVGL